MIKVVNLNISSSGFKILPIDNYFHLTSADRPYYPYPTDGGIKVIPELSITNIENGILYTSQVCKHHKLTVETDKEHYTFDSKGIEYLDSQSQSTWYYGFFPIEKNKVRDTLRMNNIEAFFDDAPYKGLCPWWKKVDYEIEFETWFQYKPNLDLENLIPLFSFSWSLKALVEQNKDVWQLISSDFSSKQSIKESVKYYKMTDTPKQSGHLKNLFQAVKEFESEHEELIRKM